MKYIIFGLVFVFIVLPVLAWLMNTFHIYGLKLVRGRYGLKPEARLKPFERQLFAHAEQALYPLGFEFSHYQAYADIVKSVSQVDNIAVYWHPEHRLYAEVLLPKNPDTARPLAVEFVTFYSAHTLVGKDREAEGVFKGCDLMHCVPLNGRSMASLLESYLMKKVDFEAAHQPQQMDRLSPLAFVKRSEQNTDDYLRFLLQSGKVHKKKDKQAGRVLCITFLSSMKLAWQLLKQKTPHELLSADAHDAQINDLTFLHQAEAKAHQRANSYQSASQVKRLGKLLLFIASVVFFGLVIGIAWDPWIVLLLAPVLLFHELGHAAAMTAFGYRDLQILFLPIGAVAMGKKETPSVLQKTWVSLAGPVPGLVLAFLLILWQPEFMVSMYGIGLVFMLVVINYLNLMPFMPLDGGHVVNDLIFDRWPSLQLIFKILGVLVFAYFAWVWSDPILTFLAVFLGLALKNDWKQFQLIKQLDEHEMRGKNEFQQLLTIYEKLATQNTLFVDKVGSVNAALKRFKHAKPKLRETAIGMAAYLFFLISPVVFIDQYMEMDLLSLFTTDQTAENSDDYYEYQGSQEFDEQQWDASYYQKRIDALGSATEKKVVYQEAMNFAEQQGYNDFISPLAKGAVALYESNDWRTDETFNDWKQLELETIIFERYDQDNEAEWRALEALMTDDKDAFYQHVAISMYSKNTHIYQSDVIERMEQAKTAGEWEMFIDLFLALNSMKTNRGEIVKALQDSEAALSLVPESESYPLSRLRHHHVSGLFADQQYLRVIQWFQALPPLDFEYENGGLHYLYQVIWASIALNEGDQALGFIEQYLQITEKQTEDLNQEIGYLGRLLLKQAEVDSTDYITVPFHLALALNAKDDSKARKLLDDYLILMNFNKLADDEKKAQFENIQFAAESERLNASDMKMRYVWQAIKKFKPELMDGINEP